jgi:flavin-dependent dehydrogenase
VVPLSVQPRLVRGRVLLCGDAAGATDPLLGEGISGALTTGLLAGRWAAAVLRGRELAGYEAAARWALARATGLSRVLFGLRLCGYDPWLDRAFGLLARLGAAGVLRLALR